MGTLILASRQDIASMNILSEVMKLNCWGSAVEHEHGVVTGHLNMDVEVLLIEELHIWADGIDSTHENLTGFEVDETLILSRHVSASETPALTLHAIGVPGELPHGERGQAGGVKGLAVPPSPRFADLFRTMKRLAGDFHLDEAYDITLEATHHGPLLESPALFLEIGSTRERWNDEKAGRVWAETISRCLGLSGESINRVWKGKGEVMLGLGGGHYAPRHKSVVSETDVWVGHILANYALVFEEQVDDGPPGGPWKHSVLTAVESTKMGFPGGEVFAHLDRKSFKGWQRQALASLLEDKGIPVRRGKQILPP